ncbi:TPA: hypothetical protein N0F65_004287 [Lagenidium giganteum]|uniref:Protein HIRA n=1 Tax=Lagenidium giganteum TaxID=4803 RepID=A0AAV2ZDY6_9STRA|nr:TPA: hypothetical protein N0F65_004287 [Lagenidium giganteum]
MLLEKPDDVKHENASGNACAIYSIDAHPTKEICATAGGGERARATFVAIANNSVKIWSLAASDDDGIATFELLATLCYHEQAVNCVRWAAHGRYLASGSDDQLVLLYELQEGEPAPVPFGSNAKRNRENWVRCSTLKRHTMDVQDVAWSPDDRMLATCSIDNTILVWNVDISAISPVMSQPLRTLSGHNGWVKGVAWDPVGKYLSSAGEDKTVRLWRVDTWQEAEVISEPFESCATTSHFRRLSWSPDGSALCATHAFSSKKNIGAILNRTTWANEVKFVGHQGVVTTARFNPKLLVADAAPDKEYACCAIGGDDATVSIWLAQLARPLAVIKDCFDSSVTDLTWSSSGYLLLACSLDGTICCFQFDSTEIGKPITLARQSKLLQSKYGDRAGMTVSSTLVENPIQLQLEEKGTAPARAASAPFNARPVATANGAANVLQPRKKGQPSSRAQAVVNAPPVKKRISPLQVTGASSTGANGTANGAIGAAGVPPKTPAELFRSATEEKLLDARITGAPAPQADDVANDSESSANKSTKNAAPPTVEAKKPREVSAKRKRESERPLPVQAPVAMPKMKEVATRPPRELLHGGAQVLPELPFHLSFTVEVDTGTASDGNKHKKTTLDIQVHNMKGTQLDDVVETGPVYTTVRCYEDGSMKWMDRLPDRVVCACGNRSFFALGTSNGDLFVLSATGRRLFPPIVLGDPFSVMEASLGQSPFLLTITTDGTLRIWNVLSGVMALVETIHNLVVRYKEDTRLTLIRTQVTARGQSMLTFATSKSDSSGPSTLQTFVFDTQMRAWMRVADDSFVYSDFHSTLITDTVLLSEIPVGPLRRLQNASGYGRTQRGIASALLSGMTEPMLQRHVTRSHLEHQVTATTVLRSADEYLYWIKAYVKFLAQDEDVSRLEELCVGLLGPFHAPSQKQTVNLADPEWTDVVFDGVSKRKVLKTQVLPMIATNRSLQRLVTKYQLMLQEMDDRAQASC